MATTGFIANQNKKGCVSTKLVGFLKNVEEQNKARIDLGLKPLVVRERKCLQCDLMFTSRNENRTCNPCRDLARYRAGIGE